jgi:hypothetical protein
MSAAKIAALYVHAWCRQTFPPKDDRDRSVNMASTVLTGGFLDVFDFKDHGTHKYIPTERLNSELGFEQGAGVYGYVKMHDGSYLLMTCDGPLATWSGVEGEVAELDLEVRVV